MLWNAPASSKGVRAPISPDFEIAEILRRAMCGRKPALPFENVKGFDIPVAGNLFGSEKRRRIALRIRDGDDANRDDEILVATSAGRMGTGSNLLGFLEDYSQKLGCHKITFQISEMQDSPSRICRVFGGLKAFQ